jgi:hypothetical protein
VAERVQGFLGAILSTRLAESSVRGVLSGGGLSGS